MHNWKDPAEIIDDTNTKVKFKNKIVLNVTKLIHYFQKSEDNLQNKGEGKMLKDNFIRNEVLKDDFIKNSVDSPMARA